MTTSRFPEWLVSGHCWSVARLINDETYYRLSRLGDELRRGGSVLVQASAVPVGSEVLKALSVALPATAKDDPLPADIQWMPPGQHKINASVNGKPGTRTVNVTAKTAQIAQAALVENQAAVAAGTEDRFYFDFNHADAEASGTPTEFYWGGDDPKTGGVRAKLEWSSAGEASVRGKTYRRFSPSFYLDAAGQVTGVPVNAGGLVNRAAFKVIQPVRAKEADDTNPNTNHPMNKLLLVLASLGIIKKHDADEDTAVSDVQAFAAANRTALDEGVKAKADFTALKTSNDKLVKAHATSVVEAAIAEGKLPGKNDELKAKWIDQIVANPDSEQLLASLQPNPALKTVVNARSATQQAEQPGEGGGNEHPFIVKAKAIETERKVSTVMAQELAANEDPKLYDEYRESFYKQ